MLRVQCESCHAPYEVDERRLPPGGMRMRCPQCGTTFQVHAAQAQGAASAGSPPRRPPPAAAPAAGAKAPPPAGGAKPPPPAGGVEPGASGAIAPPFQPAARPEPSAEGGAGWSKPPVGGDRGEPRRPSAPARRGIAPPFEQGGVGLHAAPSSKAERGPSEPELPALKPSAPKPPERSDNEAFERALELDLPAPKGRVESSSGRAGGRAAQPAQASRPPAAYDEPELPARKPSPPGTRPDEPDLPAPKQPASAGEADELDLPALKDAGGHRHAGLAEDLPTPRKSASRAGNDDADLPAPRDPPPPARRPRVDEANLAELDLPDLPPPASARQEPAEEPAAAQADDISFEGLLESDAPPPQPEPVDPDFGELDLPVSRKGASLPAPKPSTPENEQAAFDELRFDEGLEGLPPENASAPSTEAYETLELDDIEPPSSGSDDVGAEGFGEVDLPIGGEASVGEELELGSTREARLTISEAPPAEAPPRPDDAARQRDTRRNAWRKLGLAAAVMLLLGAGGVALSWTPYGLFGVYFAERFLPSAGDPAVVQRVIEQAERQATSGTYRDIRASLRMLGEARANAGLNRRLLARSLLHESLYQAAFVEDSASAQRSGAIAARLRERGWQAPGAALARAAEAVSRDDAEAARQFLAQARGTHADDPYLPLVEGQLALSQGKPQQAAEAFEQAATKGAGARASGMAALAQHAAGELQAAAKAVQGTLQQSPRHGRARALAAWLHWQRDEQEQALSLADEVLGKAPVDGTRLRAAAVTRGRALAVKGRYFETHGRLSEAGRAYEAALQADGHQLDALLGSGRVLTGQRRPGDALGRFRSARKQAETLDPPVLGGRRASVEAQLGIGRAQLVSGEADAARATLAALAEAHPKDWEIRVELGRAEQALGQHEQAEARFRAVIESHPRRFEGYLALSQLRVAQGQREQAAEVLERAAEHVEESPAVRRMLGQSELGRGRVDAAIEQLRRALELDPQDSETLFTLGVALREAGRLDEAWRMFERIGGSVAGLARQRGLLLEAQQRYAEAAERYREALEREPGDVELLVRLGAVQVASGALDEAEATLQKAKAKKPDAAEAHYFLGRVDLGRGKAREALAHFDRALSLEPSRASYHFYAGRAALQLERLGRVLDEAQAALDRDSSLGDAYWLRGTVRLRMGAVKDALGDLQRALELNPERHEAYAAMGDCYEQLRKLDQAIEAYEKALEHRPEHAPWWYRLGRLRLDDGRQRAAAEALQQAARLGEAQQDTPAWLADAYRIQGEALRAIGRERQALQQYEKYLDLAAADALDRREVERLVARLR